MNFNEAIKLRPNGGFRVIYADPPWAYENWSKKGSHKNASSHYECMTIENIYNMKVEAIAGSNSILFLWVTDPLLPEGLETIKRWGFEYKASAFTWHKTRPSGAEFMGLGYYTRGNPEMCLIGTRGSVGRPKNKGVRQFQQFDIRDHSRKPDQIRRIIEEMYDGPRIELFARQKFDGWESWGNELDKFNQNKELLDIQD